MVDSGATANFVSVALVEQFSLPQTPLPSPVVVNLADGRTSVISYSVTLDLVVGSLQCKVACLPTTLAHHDVILGKPWLTTHNPVINYTS